MAERHMQPSDLLGKVIDVHSHLGVSLKMYANVEFPYAQSIEGLHYRQLAAGVDVNVVFPFSPDLFFDPNALMAGEMVPAERPLSEVPYGVENRMLMHEIFRFCPEHRERFLPFVSIDPGRKVEGQIAALEELEREFPIYGIKISPVGCQTRITELLDRGRPFLDFARQRDLPLLLHTTVDPRETYSHARYAFEVIEATPDLRFCLAHCIAFHRGFLDRAAAMENVWVDTSALAIQVQVVASGSSVMATGSDRFGADYGDFRRVMVALAEAYPEMILWGTDSPYYSFIARRKQGEGAFAEFRLKGRYEGEKAALDSLPAGLREKVSNTNTLRFLFGKRG
jgi:predicted TIM-barrel fold metal-dependent hydrolase